MYTVLFNPIQIPANPQSEPGQANPNPAKPIHIKMLGFTWFYSAIVHLPNRKPRRAGGRGSGRRLLHRREPIGLGPRHKPKERVGDVVSGSIVEGVERPRYATFDWRPNPEERAFMWKGKPPPFDETSHGRMYDVNKKLTNDLCGGIAVKIGGVIARSTIRNRFRDKQHRT